MSKALNKAKALDYAWKWFQYHAGQRMVAFNFFLILTGALSVGYHKACDSETHGPAAIVAFVGVVVALAFLVLEFRNEELVNLGREALKKLEHTKEFKSFPKACKLLTHDRKRCSLISHKFWLRAIEALLLLIFVCAFLFSACKVVCEWKCINETKQYTGSPGYQPTGAAMPVPDTRSRWSLDFVRNLTILEASNTGSRIQMPYIKQERRDAILKGAKPENAGELNFAITVVVDKYLQDKGGIRYAHLNEVMGVMECAKLELYRRLAAPYEDEKIKEAGDVYKSNKNANPSTSTPSD